jgi:predicted porin
MNKKLMALAVAGALAAPAAALAQTTIYGVFNAEYGFASQPNNAANNPRQDAEGFNSGASRFGLRGEEKMGGGLTTWYQCESDVGFLSTSTSGGANICDRNSALGIKGGFGNFYVGNWDSPIKRASGVTRITNETGWLGSQHITLSSANGPANFSARHTQTFNYDTPNMGGFSANVQFTSLQATFNATANAVAEGRVVGLGGQFATGPFAVVAAYEKRDENRATGSLATSEDTAWLIGATYVFGPVKLGLTYTTMETQPTATTTVERTAWNVAADIKAGPQGTVRVGYALADDLEGTTKVANSGAKQYQISYLHAFSKRTVGTIGYVKLDNDSAGTYNLQGLSAGAANVFPGDGADAFTIALSHSF